MFACPKRSAHLLPLFFTRVNFECVGMLKIRLKNIHTCIRYYIIYPLHFQNNSYVYWIKCIAWKFPVLITELFNIIHSKLFWNTNMFSFLSFLTRRIKIALLMQYLIKPKAEQIECPSTLDAHKIRIMTSENYYLLSAWNCTWHTLFTKTPRYEQERQGR